MSFHIYISFKKNHAKQKINYWNTSMHGKAFHSRIRLEDYISVYKA